MNTELLEEFENSCEFYRNEFKHCSYDSTAIFKPYYSFEDSAELDGVLKNSKGGSGGKAGNRTEYAGWADNHG